MQRSATRHKGRPWGRHGYDVSSLDELCGRELDVALAARPTFGLGLSSELGSACSAGNLQATGVDLLDAARDHALPPVGSRLVIGRVELASLATAAWLDLRVTKADKPGRGRFHELVGCLRRSPDLCARLRGDVLSLFEDADASLVRATVCNLAHDSRLPLRYRVEVVGAYLRRGAFVGSAGRYRQAEGTDATATDPLAPGRTVCAPGDAHACGQRTKSWRRDGDGAFIDHLPPASHGPAVFHQWR